MKAHLKQTPATELYQELPVSHQEERESPQDFLMRAVNLKQHIIFVSNATDSSIKYEPSLVQALFLHAIETGGRRGESVVGASDIAPEDQLFEPW